MGNGSAFDFAINISQATQQAIKFLEEKINGVAKSLGKATQKGKKFVKSFLDRADKSIRKKGGFFDKEKQRRLEELGDSADGTHKKFLLIAKITDNVSIGFGAMNNMIAKTIGIVYLLQQGFDSLAEISDGAVEAARKNFLAFGSMQKSMNQFKRFQGDIISGKLKGDAQDFVDAAAELNMMGVKNTDELMKTANDVARLRGTSTSDVIGQMNAFAQGDLNAFDDIFSKDKLMRKYKGYEGNQKALTKAIITELQGNKDIAKAAKNMPVTFAELGKQMKTARQSFVQAVFGSTADPNSFAGQVAKSFEKVMAYFNSKKEQFIKIAGFLSGVFKALWTSVTQIFNGLVKPIFEKFFAFVDKNLSDWQDTTSGLVLYISLVTNRVIKFLQEYGKLLLYGLALYKLWGVAKLALGIGKRIVFSVHRYFRVFRVGLWKTKKMMTRFGSMFTRIFAFAPKLLTGVRTALMGVRAGMMGVNVAMLANPIGLIIAAVVALIAYIVYLVKHWEEIRVKMQDVGDTTIALVSVFMPLIGIPMLLAKHWEKFKVIFHNLWAGIYNTVMSFWFMIKYYAGMVGEWFIGVWNKLTSFFSEIGASIADFFSPITEFFSSLWDNIYDMIPDWLKDFGGWIYDSMTSIGDTIANWFADLWNNLKPEWLDDLLNWLGDETEDGANESKKTAEYWARKAGDTEFRGMAGKSTRGIDEKAAADKALADKKLKEDKEENPWKYENNTPIPSSPVMDMNNIPSMNTSTYDNSGGDTVNNNVTINVPAGSSTAEITKIVEQVMAKNKRKADLRNM